MSWIFTQIFTLNDFCCCLHSFKKAALLENAYTYFTLMLLYSVVSFPENMFSVWLKKEKSGGGGVSSPPPGSKCCEGQVYQRVFDALPIRRRFGIDQKTRSVGRPIWP